MKLLNSQTLIFPFSRHSYAGNQFLSLLNLHLWVGTPAFVGTPPCVADSVDAPTHPFCPPEISVAVIASCQNPDVTQNMM